MAKGSRWSSDELLIAFRLYCRMPFGRLHQHNPEIIQLAEMIDRTPSAVAMKACNFASLDPVQQERGISGLGNVSSSDREIWERFLANPEAIAAEAEAVAENLTQSAAVDETELTEPPTGPTEAHRLMRARRVQSFFRAAVLASYDIRCALTDLNVRPLLNASHIIPWSKDEARRADPRNGLCLNVLHDRAFDRGLITFDENYRLVLGKMLKSQHTPNEFQRVALIAREGARLRLPERFCPDDSALAYHRESIFDRDVA
jgi:putative restriction endonuclease